MLKEDLVKKTLEELNKRYPIGLYEFLYTYRRELYIQMIDIEDCIDQNLLNADSSIEELKIVLREYWTFHMKAIQLFESNNTQEINLPEAREEMLEERMRA